jgi:very-short-patch-repair endonuclease
MYCSVCKRTISVGTYNYSKDKFGKALCREHQGKHDDAVIPKATTEARLLCDALRDRGFDVEKEKFDGFKHVDLAIAEAKIYIEVEGSHHNLNSEQALRDLKRAVYSSKDGYETISIPNSPIRERLDETADWLAIMLRERKHAIEYSQKKLEKNSNPVSRFLDVIINGKL